jgi:hypothetical protein
MKARRRIAAPKAQGLCGPCYGLTQLQQGFAHGGMGSDRHFCGATILKLECPLWVKSRHPQKLSQLGDVRAIRRVVSAEAVDVNCKETSASKLLWQCSRRSGAVFLDERANSLRSHRQLGQDQFSRADK